MRYDLLVMRWSSGVVAFAVLILMVVLPAGSASVGAEAEIPEACRGADRLEQCVEERVRETEREIEHLRNRTEEAFRTRIRRSCEEAATGGALGAETIRALCRLERLEERRSDLERRLRELTPSPPRTPEAKDSATSTDRVVRPEEPVTETPPEGAEVEASPEERPGEAPDEPLPVRDPAEPEPPGETSDEPSEETPPRGPETAEERKALEEPAEVSRGRGPVRATSAPASSVDREPEIVPMESPMTLEIELPEMEAIPEGYGWPTTETRTFEVEGVRLPKVTVEKKRGRGGVRLIVRPAIRSSSYLDHARIDLEIRTPGGETVATGTTDWFPVGRSLPRQAEGGLVKEVELELSEEQDRALRESPEPVRLRLTVHVRD